MINIKKVLQWIVLVWTVIGSIYVVTDMNTAWDETLYSLIYSGLVFGLMVSELKDAKTNKGK